MVAIQTNLFVTQRCHEVLQAEAPAQLCVKLMEMARELSSEGSIEAASALVVASKVLGEMFKAKGKRSDP